MRASSSSAKWPTFVSIVALSHVVAQDVNDAQPAMTPEEAAQIIGGQIRTPQLTVNFQGGTCPKVPMARYTCCRGSARRGGLAQRAYRAPDVRSPATRVRPPARASKAELEDHTRPAREQATE